MFIEQGWGYLLTLVLYIHVGLMVLGIIDGFYPRKIRYDISLKTKELC